MASDQFPSRNVSAALPRRSFLFLAAPAAVAGGAAGLCSGAFAATPCAPAEAPEFSALVATYERADAAFLAADRARADALAMYHQLRPPVPDALVLTYEDELLGLDGDLERDVEGNQVYGPNGRDRRIITTEQLRFHAQITDRARRRGARVARSCR